MVFLESCLFNSQEYLVREIHTEAVISLQLPDCGITVGKLFLEIIKFK